MAERIDATYFTPLKTVTGFECITGGVELKVDDMTMQVHVLRADVMRLRIAPEAFVEQPTFAVSADLGTRPQSSPCQGEGDVEFDVTHDAKSIRVSTPSMTLVIGRAPFRIDAHRADGSVIFETANVNPSANPGRGGADTAMMGAFLHLNDEFLVARKIGKKDAILGLGEKTGAFNRRGRRFTLWNTDVLDPDASGQFMKGIDKSDPRRDPTSTSFDPYYMSIPFFYHVDHSTGAAAGFFVDNGYCGRFEFDHGLTPEDAPLPQPLSPPGKGEPKRTSKEVDCQYRFHFTGGQYTEYIFAGPSIRDILAQYTWLTGRMPAPPLWTLGHHQCRWHPYDHEKLTDLGEKFRGKDIPCDSLWLDIDYMRGYRVYTWNTEFFPDIAQTLSDLKERGFRVITIVDPGVKHEPGYPVFDEGVRRNVFCKTPAGRIYTGQVWPGKTAFPDFVKAEGREWWGKLTAEHIGLGIAGIWNDMNEPATGRIPAASMLFDDGKYPHEAYHNQYAMLMAMATQEGMLEAEPDKRTFILSRAGFAGMQRYAANWMGDNMARWDHLKMSVAMAMGLGLSGQAFVGADIGGFAEDCNDELLLRWMQYGALTPFCRNHNNAGCRDQYPWAFGVKTQKFIRESLQLRYRLIPYLYAAFLESVENGAPVQRPLAFDYQSDKIAREVEDQYLLGRDLLVAPVYEAGVKSRHVYLPEGSWQHWFTGERFAGGKTITAKTPADHIPFYARGGAIIPMWAEAPASTMGYHPDVVELHAFVPSEDGEFTSMLQEDDGLTFAFKNGACYRTGFTLTRKAGRVTIAATVTGRGYPEFRREKFTLAIHGAKPSTVEVDGAIVDVKGGRVEFVNAGVGFAASFDVA